MATTRIVTLNEVLGYMKAFQESHGMLNDFGYGSTSEIGTSRQMSFPYMWVSHQSDSYIRVLNKTSLPELKFLVFFMDQINIQENFEDTNGENSDNGQEVMSDMFQCVQDLVMEIEKSWGVYGIKISEDVRFFPGFDETQDAVNGWVCEITLKLSYVNCSKPE